MFHDIRKGVIQAIDRGCGGHEAPTNCALCERQTLTPLTKIALATKYDVSAWLLPAYSALCLREQPLSVEEAIQLGPATSARLADIREAVLKFKIEAGQNCCVRHFQWHTVCKCGREATVNVEEISRIARRVVQTRVIKAFQLREDK